MARPGRRAATLVVVVLVLVAAAVAVAVSAADRAEPAKQSAPVDSAARSDAPGHTHVHLGDSYAAGAGVQPLLADSPFLCQRAERNFGQLVAEAERWDLVDVSCSGARTAHLAQSQYEGVRPQLEAVGPETETVTMTLGGNDSALFTSLIGTCARLGRQQQRGSPCRSEMGARVERILAGTQRDLTAGLRAIAERAPKARVFVVGYPWILPAQQGCYDRIPIAAGDVPFVHDGQARLNTALRRSAEAAGATFVDMSGRARGHDACAEPGQRWVEPMTVAGPASLHPNADGQRAMADAVLAALDS
ncbi:MAG: SGNH/GDSL hydrolase family protein [Gordonia sp. (in: high G+C Gram-positive bacteria)]|uniref:SGNH/GDSL hydrolase family protein n=1 Tax=Gordonia sp. (in: high G+C Gram-positive bacteria) TaxID=84139 RepID=UPI0039E5CBC8